MKRTHCLLIVLAAAVGCGGDDEFKKNRPAVVPAEGVLTYQGQPVDGATVILAPEVTGPEAVGASAMTDAEGHFVLSAYPPDEGVVPGRYKVGVSKTIVTGTPAASHDAPSTSKTEYVIPKKFSDPNAAGLPVEIPADGNKSIQLDLK